jgi:hypothetical protein
MSTTHPRKFGISILLLAIILSFFLSLAKSPVLAQNGQAPAPPVSTDTPEGRELIHLGALGTYSAGFVLEAYGYIGVLGDMLHYGVYVPDIIRSMLG